MIKGKPYNPLGRLSEALRKTWAEHHEELTSWLEEGAETDLNDSLQELLIELIILAKEKNVDFAKNAKIALKQQKQEEKEDRQEALARTAALVG